MEELVEKVIALYGETVDSEVAVAYLELAESLILNRMYPFGYEDGTEIPTKYQMTLVQLTVRLLARRAGEGEISHSENGVSRTYGSVNDEDILSIITPIAKVL